MVLTSFSVKSNSAAHGGFLIPAHCSRNAAAARSIATSSSAGIAKMASRIFTRIRHQLHAHATDATRSPRRRASAGRGIEIAVETDAFRLPPGAFGERHYSRPTLRVVILNGTP